jgi:hypothetical protein
MYYMIIWIITLSIRPKESFMNIRVVIEFDEETHSYSAVCPELPGCASFGDTEDEAFQNVKEAHVY